MYMYVHVRNFETTTYYSFALHFVFSPSDQCTHSTPLSFKQKQGFNTCTIQLKTARQSINRYLQVLFEGFSKKLVLK